MTQRLMTVDQWVEMFREIGLDEERMHRWHSLFEQRHPDAHQRFLLSLGMSPERVAEVRRRSKEELGE